jgi:hypothetical protein
MVPIRITFALMLFVFPGWCCTASSASNVPALRMAGCRCGSRRVGTIYDPTLRQRWAVVVNCAHPSWPAHLEPASEWPSLPPWVPAGTSVEVRAENGHVTMKLSGKTVTAGRVGEQVRVQLLGRSLLGASWIDVRLEGAGKATLVPHHHWGQL